MGEDQDGGALTKVSKGQALTYAKWGLTGLGALTLVGFVLKVLFNPLFLVATVAAGAGGFYWWAKKGKDDPDVQAAADRVAREVDKAKSAADSVAQVAALSRSLSGKGAAAEKPAPRRAQQSATPAAAPPGPPPSPAASPSPPRPLQCARQPGLHRHKRHPRLLSLKPRRSW